ncbi:MAG: SDR family oxidoreductase [Verrucomicrobia bacterium]|jgi:NAD(P)-dependent dehydrogenase (short-subunit alcohol dehydrogenase family)|nr:SDR family oxidoreductase [Verrucomicrobiota bacterium]
MPVPQRIIVTGAARGIGRAIAGHLLESGCQVLLIDRNEERLAATTSGFEREYPGRVESQVMDLSDAEAILKGFAKHPWLCEGLDGLVNNAAVALHKSLADISPEEIEQTWRVNMRAPMLMTKVCLSALERNRGAVVNISSVAAHRPHPTYAFYASSKAFLDCFTRHVATETGPRGVRINNVSPGGIETELLAEVTDTLGKTPEHVRAVAASIPLEQRWGKPEEVAECVAFALFGPRYLHGETIRVDGGIYTV